MSGARSLAMAVAVRVAHGWHLDIDPHRGGRGRGACPAVHQRAKRAAALIEIGLIEPIDIHDRVRQVRPHQGLGR